MFCFRTVNWSRPFFILISGQSSVSSRELRATIANYKQQYLSTEETIKPKVEMVTSMRARGGS